jgi:uncharacterized membrane protein
MTDKTHDRFQLERMAFFSDAVFAIAITLLVIEVRLPEVASDSNAALLSAFGELFPKFLGFLISFLVIGRFWIGHHRVMGHLHTCDDRLIWRNLLFLLTIAFMPFPTAVISEYGASPVGVGFYAGWLMLSGILYRRMLAYALRSPDLVNRHDSSGPRETLIQSAWAPIVIGGLALLLAMYNPALALVPLVASPLIVRAINAVATRGAERVTE